MDTILNGSFTSPLANANLRLPTDSDDTGLLSSLYNGVSGWNAVLTLLLALVAYDQSEALFASLLILLQLLITACSQLQMAERSSRWPIMEDSFHGSFPRIRLP